ncbi:sugar phosphate nucleotidyltransferase [Candidatus Pelagibacter sp.]|nr:sugar phosphate nucleotidyltransferase [Candidatus Pelagibacter sp.]
MFGKMQTVILAGGMGTRLAEYTKTIPKPMVKVAGKPILIHIMNIYLKYGYTDFILSLGFKAQIIANYFIKDKKISLKHLRNGLEVKKKINNKICSIKLVYTGKKTLTGGRIKLLNKHLRNGTFMCTYGDGVSNVNINKLVKFHKKHGKLVTVTAVRPMSRFGRLDIEGNRVIQFKEKTQMDRGWINGGFFVFEKKFLDLIKNSKTILEKEPLEKACLKRSLVAYKHKKFWQCMDTKRDRDILNKVIKNEL